MEYKFKFSVVIPAGEDADALRETLNSIISQDIGFENNIQIILVGDGNAVPDMKEMCLEYRERYPEQIVYEERTDQNISAARNSGIKSVQGKYVNFARAGGSWTKPSFRVVYDFFEKKEEVVDLVSCPQRQLVEKSSGKEAPGGTGGKRFWPLSGDKKGNRVIDVLEQYQEIQLYVTGSFVKAEVLANHRFDERLGVVSDIRFINSILLDRGKYGVAAGACYRCRGENESFPPAQRRESPKEWYLEAPRGYDLEIIQESIDKYGFVIPYIQYLILYGLQYRLREDLTNVLTKEEQDAYETSLKEILSYLDDDLICQMDKMYVEYKIYVLSLKYGYDITTKLRYRKGVFSFNNVRIYSMQAKSLFSLDVLAVREGMLHLSGRIWNPLAEDLRIYIEREDGEIFDIGASPAGFRKAVILGKEIMQVRGYEIVLPLEGAKQYTIYGRYKKKPPRRLSIKFGKFSHLSHEVKELYYQDGGYLIGYDEKKGCLTVQKNRVLTHIAKELRLLLRCIHDRKAAIAGYRVLSHVMRPFLKKERWLVMERINVAGDNAEHFYKFLKKNEGREIRSFFTISEDCADYERMKQVGTVLPFRKFRHKLNVLLAKNIISSQGEDNIFNPWDNDSSYICDLYKYNYIFLQHGIIKDDLSGWLNKFNKNLQMFVTSAKPEYRSILEGDYFYDEKVVKLTGLPRYDNLKQDITPDKSIVFMPTWRFSLAGKLDNDTGERKYNPLFKQSPFYRFYQSLIHDERLIRVMKENGYTGKFFLHPQHKVQNGDFTDSDTIKVVREGIDYQEEFQKNALLITDFSSVAFDFAYLKKPVIYTHFDRDTFFQGQIYSEGYFEYERDGLGPVCYDYETTRQAIIDAITGGCRLEPLYDERGNRFYQWFDDKNCQRVYEEIRALEE